MDPSQQKEQFSIAWVRTVVSVAGYAVYQTSVDDDSVDLGIAMRGGRGTVRSPRLEVQLKCTAAPNWQSDLMRFPLKRKNYDDLRVDNVLAPRMLIVVCVPKDVNRWLDQNADRMVLRQCGYLTPRASQRRPDGVAAMRILPVAPWFSRAAGITGVSDGPHSPEEPVYR